MSVPIAYAVCSHLTLCSPAPESFPTRLLLEVLMGRVAWGPLWLQQHSNCGSCSVQVVVPVQIRTPPTLSPATCHTALTLLF